MHVTKIRSWAEVLMPHGAWVASASPSAKLLRPMHEAAVDPPPSWEFGGGQPRQQTRLVGHRHGCKARCGLADGRLRQRRLPHSPASSTHLELHDAGLHPQRLQFVRGSPFRNPEAFLEDSDRMESVDAAILLDLHAGPVTGEEAVGEAIQR